MTYHIKIREESFFKRRKIKKDLRQIFEEEGFKRRLSKLRHPFTELYRVEDLTAKIYSTTEERGYEPLIYYAVGLEINGSTENPIFSRTEERLRAYLNQIKEKK
jgi:hypothetical protein